MTKSSESEQARRVNATVNLLNKKISRPKILSRLMAQHAVSRRQAYRYLQLAQSTPGPVPVPEAKTVFTVKLSVSLIRQVRQQAHRQEITISSWVEQALRRSLNPRRRHG